MDHCPVILRVVDEDKNVQIKKRKKWAEWRPKDEKEKKRFRSLVLGPEMSRHEFEKTGEGGEGFIVF